MNSAYLEITAAPWVVVGDRWHDGLFGIELAAPPSAITRSSPPADVDRASAALSLGLASAQVVAAGSARRVLAGITLPLQTSHAVLLPRRIPEVLARLTVEFSRTHLVPIAAAAAALTASSVLGIPEISHVVCSLTLVLVAVLVHELGHACTYRILAKPEGPAVFVMNRRSPRLVWPPMSRRKDVTTVVAGPLSPVLMPVVLLAFPHALPEVIVAGVVAVAHLVSLALPTGDGAQLRSVLATVDAQPR